MSKFSFFSMLTVLLILAGCSGDDSDHQYTGISEGTSVSGGPVWGPDSP